MPVSPVAGVPPISTLQAFDRQMANFAPYYIAPGLTKKNFYRENGQIILAAIVALLLLVSLFLFQQGVLASAPASALEYTPFSF